MDIEELKIDLRADEGYRNKTYRCTAGRKTIGYGHQSDALGDNETCTMAQAEAWLDDDITKAITIAEMFLQGRKSDVSLDSLTDARQRVIVNMGFNLGFHLLQFKRFRAAILDGDYQLAADEMMQSLWARQVGKRAARLAELMRKG